MVAQDDQDRLEQWVSQEIPEAREILEAMVSLAVRGQLAQEVKLVLKDSLETLAQPETQEGMVPLAQLGQQDHLDSQEMLDFLDLLVLQEHLVIQAQMDCRVVQVELARRVRPDSLAALAPLVQPDLLATQVKMVSQEPRALRDVQAHQEEMVFLVDRERQVRLDHLETLDYKEELDRQASLVQMGLLERLDLMVTLAVLVFPEIVARLVPRE